MWERMMQAGEDYVKSSLQTVFPPDSLPSRQSSLQTRTSFVVARPSSRHGPVAV
jgi:hypothetical protein